MKFLILFFPLLCFSEEEPNSRVGKFFGDYQRETLSTFAGKFVVAGTLSAGYYLRQDLAIFVGYNGWTHYSFDEGGSVESAGTVAGIKKFWAHSFYTRSGLSKHSFTLVRDRFYRTTGEFYAIDFSIGNHWDLGRIYLGGDWVGFSGSVGGWATTEYNSTGKTSEHDADEPQLLTGMRLRGPNLYIGMTF